MDKYYFVDEKPQDVPGYYKGGFVVSAIGMQISPNLSRYMARIAGIQSGVVHKVRISAEADAFDNVAWFNDSLSYMPKASWDTLPIVVWLYKSGINLDILNTYIGVLTDRVHASHKPLLYVTKGMWDGWLKGPNAETVAKTILTKADFILADYSPQAIELPVFAEKVQWVESEQGIIFNDPTGKFEGFNDPPPPPPPQDPPEPPVEPGAGYIIPEEITLHIHNYSHGLVE